MVSPVTSQAKVRRVRVRVNPVTVSLVMRRVRVTVTSLAMVTVMAIAVKSMTVVVRSSLVTLLKTSWSRSPRVPMQSLIVRQLVSHVLKHFIGGNHAIF
jgi:hypothetical protein